jgi:hypothetical protein
MGRESGSQTACRPFYDRAAEDAAFASIIEPLHGP